MADFGLTERKLDSKVEDPAPWSRRCPMELCSMMRLTMPWALGLEGVFLTADERYV